MAVVLTFGWERRRRSTRDHTTNGRPTVLLQLLSHPCSGGGPSGIDCRLGSYSVCECVTCLGLLGGKDDKVLTLLMILRARRPCLIAGLIRLPRDRGARSVAALKGEDTEVLPHIYAWLPRHELFFLGAGDPSKQWASGCFHSPPATQPRTHPSTLQGGARHYVERARASTA